MNDRKRSVGHASKKKKKTTTTCIRSRVCSLKSIVD